MRYLLIPLFLLSACSLAPEDCLDCAPAGVTVGMNPTDLPKPRPGSVVPAAGEVTATPLAAPPITEEAAAAKPGALGSVVASLGDAGRAGLWLETTLVTKPQKGRVTLASGKSVDVDLIPIAGEPGAGGRLSIAAFQALGVKITELPVLTVSGL